MRLLNPASLRLNPAQCAGVTQLPSVAGVGKGK